MKVLLDRGKCEGYANCLFAEPEVFDVDDKGLGIVLVEEFEESRRADLQAAAASCPAHAITLEG